MPDTTTLTLACAGFVALNALGASLVAKFGFFRVGFFTFLIASNFSLATELPSIFVFKYLRIYMTILFGLWGIWVFAQLPRSIGKLAVLWLIFFGVFVLSGSWSDHPVRALGYKGLSLCLVLGGVAAGSSCLSYEDVKQQVRSIYIAHFALAIVILLGLIASGGLGALTGRLNLFGMNPIGIGQIGTLIVASSLCVRLTEPSSGRLSQWAMIFFGALIVLLTGSRGAAASTILVVLVTLSPNLVRSFAPLFILAASTLLIIAALPSNVNEVSVDRLGKFALSDRSSFWIENIKGFYESPIFGTGWAYQTLFGGISWGQLHSIYVSVLVESGLLGGIPLLIFLGLLASRTSRWAADRSSGFQSVRYQEAFCFAIIAWILFIGLFESGPLFSSTCPLVLFSWAVGRISAPIEMPPQAAGVEARNTPNRWSSL